MGTFKIFIDSTGFNFSQYEPTIEIYKGDRISSGNIEGVLLGTIEPDITHTFTASYGDTFTIEYTKNIKARAPEMLLGSISVKEYKNCVEITKGPGAIVIGIDGPNASIRAHID